MENVVIIKVSRTENGYSATCDFLDDWKVAVTGDFNSLAKKEIEKSINDYIKYSKVWADPYDPIFDTDYELQYEIKDDDSLTEESHYNYCGDVCGDNRFEIIEKAKQHLLKNTNIETSKDEMKCLDSFLFRCWQMGWLKQFDVD